MKVVIGGSRQSGSEERLTGLSEGAPQGAGGPSEDSSNSVAASRMAGPQLAKKGSQLGEEEKKKTKKKQGADNRRVSPPGLRDGKKVFTATPLAAFGM